MEELTKLAQPLIDYLHQNYHPHTTIVITDERVTVTEDVMSVPFALDAQLLIQEDKNELRY